MRNDLLWPSACRARQVQALHIILDVVNCNRRCQPAWAADQRSQQPRTSFASLIPVAVPIWWHH